MQCERDTGSKETSEVCLLGCGEVFSEIFPGLPRDGIIRVPLFLHGSRLRSAERVRRGLGLVRGRFRLLLVPHVQGVEGNADYIAQIVLISCAHESCSRGHPVGVTRSVDTGPPSVLRHNLKAGVSQIQVRVLRAGVTSVYVRATACMRHPHRRRIDAR